MRECGDCDCACHCGSTRKEHTYENHGYTPMCERERDERQERLQRLADEAEAKEKKP